MKFLQVTFTIGVRDHRVLKRPWHSARSEQLLDGVNGLVDGRPSFRKRSVEERKLATNGIAAGRIGKPRNIVKEYGDSRRFLYVISHQDAGDLGLTAGSHLSDRSAL